MGKPRPIRERLLSRLLIDPSGCLLWTGRIDRYGYGNIASGRRMVKVHRVMYELFVGPIPDGLEIDHLCRVRHCAAPAHLEAVTRRENTLRGKSLQALNAVKTHCDHGHAFDRANTYVYRGSRYCRACNRAAKARKKAAA